MYSQCKPTFALPGKWSQIKVGAATPEGWVLAPKVTILPGLIDGHAFLDTPLTVPPLACH